MILYANLHNMVQKHPLSRLFSRGALGHILIRYCIRYYSHSIVKSCLQFAPVRHIYTWSQKSPRIHGVIFGSRFSRSSEAFSWVTVDHGKLRAATNGRMDLNVNREVHTARTEFSRFDSSLYGLRLALIPKASST